MARTSTPTYDANGKRLRCLICARVLTLALTGRPRQVCHRKNCRAQHRTAIRRQRVARGGKR